MEKYLLDVPLRFRKESVAIISDVTEMYLQMYRRLLRTGLAIDIFVGMLI